MEIKIYNSLDRLYDDVAVCYYKKIKHGTTPMFFYCNFEVVLWV